jgi:hypothetical protein
MWRSASRLHTADHVVLHALQSLLLGSSDFRGVSFICNKWDHEIQCHVRTQVLHTDDGDTEGSIHSITPI